MKKHKERCSVSRLHELFRYNALTGEVFRRVSVRPRSKKGMVAGSLDDKGYCQVGVDGKTMKLHRVIMAMVNNAWPTLEVDHINGIKSDNRLVNLRLATHSQNQVNKKSVKKKSTLPRGVRKNGKKYQAQIAINGKKIHIGTYDTQELASIEYEKVANIHFGEYVRPIEKR